MYRTKKLEKDLKKSINRHLFEIYFQPKLDINANKVCGAEALVRWKRGNKLMVGPDVFIPILEKNGLIRKLDFFVLTEVCKKINYWQKHQMQVVPIAINVSKVYILEKYFIEKWMQVLESYEVEPKYIELEITESISLEDKKELINVVNILKQKGFTTAMDDFGTGYSSLSLLKDLPIDVVKLDKGFVEESHLSVKSKMIIACSISMLHQINMQVVAEGVETREQMEFLKQLKCDMIQGYYFARPMRVEEYEKYLNH